MNAQRTMGPGLHHGDDRGLPARRRCARPHARHPSPRRLGRLARWRAGQGGPAVPALSGADGLRADGRELGAAALSVDWSQSTTCYEHAFKSFALKRLSVHRFAYVQGNPHRINLAGPPRRARRCGTGPTSRQQSEKSHQVPLQSSDCPHLLKGHDHQF